jgi:peptide deformylase
MYEELKIILWPDPRLKKQSQPVVEFDGRLAALADRMFELMRAAKGVGLAAPQVGQSVRMFIMNPTGDPKDDLVYVNPELTDASGSDEAEEGCLSLPGINVNIVRDKDVRMRAKDLQGNPIEQIASGYVARIWQHEFDHLNGIMLTDRMGSVAKLTNRRTLKELEEKYAEEHPAGKTNPKSEARNPKQGAGSKKKT